MALESIAAVTVTFALLGAALWWLARRGLARVAWPLAGFSRSRAPRPLESLGRLALGPQQTLHLVRVGSKALLVACSPSGCVLIDKLAPGEIAGEERAAS